MPSPRRRMPLPSISPVARYLAAALAATLAATLAAALLGSGAAAWAEGPPETPSRADVVRSAPLEGGLRHWLPSEALGETRAVDVHLPASYHRAAGSHVFPLILVLDGEFLFQTVVGVVGHLSSVGQMPEAIVVGVPNSTGDRLGISPRFLGNDGKPSRFGGQEEAYLRFFEAELLPFLETRYRAAPFRIAVGLSPTASFVLHSFWKAPELFQGHVAMVVGKTLGKRYSAERTLADQLVAAVEASPDRLAHLYLASASSNFDDDPAIAQAFHSLERRLASPRDDPGLGRPGLGRPGVSGGLRLATERVEGSAYAIALPALLSAFELIFPRDLWTPRYPAFLEGEGPALDALEAHFDALSAHYGFPVVPLGDRFFNRNCLRGLGSSLRRVDRNDEAVDVFRYWSELYPAEARARFHLAYALRAVDRRAEARQQAERGLELARSQGDPLLETYEQHLEDFRADAPGSGSGGDGS